VTTHVASYDRRPVFGAGTARWPYRVVAVDPAAGPGSTTSSPPLRDAGIEVVPFADGASALLCLSAQDPAAVLAPTEMLGVDFGYFVESVTELSSLPVIIGLTDDPGSHRRAYQALDQGARALVPLPAEREQLSTILHQLGLRRAEICTPRTHHAISLDPGAHRVEVAGVRVSLSPVEFAALAQLMALAPKVVSREEFAAVLYGDRELTSSHLNRIICHLRAKLGAAAPGQPDLIETVRFFGYRLRD